MVADEGPVSSFAVSTKTSPKEVVDVPLIVVDPLNLTVPELWLNAPMLAQLPSMVSVPVPAFNTPPEPRPTIQRPTLYAS